MTHRRTVLSPEKALGGGGKLFCPSVELISVFELTCIQRRLVLSLGFGLCLLPVPPFI